MSDTCAICLETFYQSGGEIGAVIPCGHCFHQMCWDRWHSERADNHRSVTCAVCKSRGDQFCRIFLDFQKITEQQQQEGEKYKAKAKKLKHRVKSLEAQLKLQDNEHRNLVESLESSQTQVEKYKMHLMDALVLLNLCKKSSSSALAS